MIPEDVRIIDSGAFEGCISLASVTLPEYLEKIKASVFSGCTSLEEIELPAYLDTIGNDAFKDCSSLKSIVIPEYVTTIESLTFSGCSRLTAVTLPENLGEIGDLAFSGCIGLENIELPNGLTTIGWSAFKDTAIKTIIIPENVEFIESRAFAATSNSPILTEAIYFPATTRTENIAPDAFEKFITILYCYKNSPMHTYAVDNGYAYVLIDGTDEDNLISGTDGQYVDWQLDKLSGILTINTSGNMPENYYPWKGYANYVTSLKITGDTTTISSSAFSGLSKLEAVELPDTIAFIGNHAFLDCSCLKNIILPEKLEVIEDGAFEDCSLKEITIPYMVSFLHERTFSGTLEKIIITNKNLSFLDYAITSNENLKIYGHADSTAKDFAESNNYTFVSLDAHEHDWLETVRVTGDNKGKSIITCRLCGEVKAKPISDKDIWLEYETVTYSFGNEYKPTVLSNGMMENVDFTVSYSNNVKVGIATVTITGIGFYTGTVTKKFTIEPANISEKSASLSCETYTYDGTAKTPTVTIDGLVEDTDFTVHYENNVNIGTASVIITGMGNYTGTITRTFIIKAPEIIDISDRYTNLSSETYTYDGTAKTPTVTIEGLVEDTDFTVEYANNINVGSATVTITGKGSYTGTITKTFTIEPADILGKSVSLSSESYIYDGTAKTPIVTIDGLVENTDFTVKYSGNTNAGFPVVEITGVGNYTGTTTTMFAIRAADISEKSVSLSHETYVYDGTAKTPAVTVEGLVEDTDFTVEYTDNVNVGTAAVTITGTGNYGGTITKTFTIEAANISEKSVSLSRETYTYDALAKTPTVTIEGLVENIDFKVKYANNTNAGIATVEITGVGNYTGTITKRFTIEAVDLLWKSVSLSRETYTYDGTAKTPTVTIDELAEYTDFTVHYENNVNIGTASVIITGVGNYTGTITKTFTIEEADLSEKSAELSNETYIYDGTAKTPVVIIDELEENVDYIVEYVNNIEVGTATVIITGIGNYTGTITKTFMIGDFEPTDISAWGIYWLGDDEYAYDGTPKRPEIAMDYLIPNVDFIVEYTDNINVGTAKVTITGIGNYTGTITRTFTIYPCEIFDKSAKLSNDTYTYDGTAKTPTVTIAGLVENVDFTVEYENNIKVGTATVTIIGKGNYEGTITETFTIVPDDTPGLSVGFNGNGGVFTIKHDGKTWLTGEYMTKAEAGTTMAGEGYSIVGDPVRAEDPERKFLGWAPRMMMKMYHDDGTFEYFMIPIETETLTTEEMLNYVIPEYDAVVFYAQWECETHYFNDWELSTPATTTSSGERTRKCIGCGKIDIEKIAQINSSVTLSKTSYTYTGSALKPTVTVKDVTGKKLNLNTDYTVKYSNNVNAGTASVSIAFMGDYAGKSITKTFKINPIEASKLTASLSNTAYTYNGKAKAPSVTVKYGSSKTLVKNTDYTVKYASGRTNAGQYSVQITYKGNYSGTKTLYYKINPIEASKLTASLSKTAYTYNGKTQTPSVTVKYGSSKTLVKNTDYTVKYASGRKNVGKYSVQITYKGNYSGTKTLYYKINPKATSIKSLTSESKGFTVKWSAVSTQTTGYQIRYSTSSSMSGAKTVTVKTNKTTSTKVKSLSAKKTYYVQIRTYKTVNGVNYYSGWSAKKSVKTK